MQNRKSPVRQRGIRNIFKGGTIHGIVAALINVKCHDVKKRHGGSSGTK